MAILRIEMMLGLATLDHERTPDHHLSRPELQPNLVIQPEEGQVARSDPQVETRTRRPHGALALRAVAASDEWRLHLSESATTAGAA